MGELSSTRAEIRIGRTKGRGIYPRRGSLLGFARNVERRKSHTNSDWPNDECGSPVLRLFDLLVFCHENGVLTTRECDDIRSELLNNGEGLPGPFQNASFVAGAKGFPCRLKAGNAASAPFPQPANYYDPLTICP